MTPLLWLPGFWFVSGKGRKAGRLTPQRLPMLRNAVLTGLIFGTRGEVAEAVAQAPVYWSGSRTGVNAREHEPALQTTAYSGLAFGFGAIR
jgi:hypothetical protein